MRHIVIIDICLIDISRVGRQSLWAPDMCYERREPRELECRGGNLSKLLWMQDVQNRQTVGQCARTAGYAYKQVHTNRHHVRVQRTPGSSVI